MPEKYRKELMSIATILLIEDSIADILVLRHCLDQLGKEYRLRILADGEEVLQFIDEHRRCLDESQPCVILLDLNLPHYDGLQLLAAIKRVPALEHIRVMVLSSLASPEQRKEVEKMGAVYRPKPSDLGRLQALAAEIMELCTGDVKVLASK